MGIILSRFRKNKTTLEELEKLDGEIKNIEEYGKITESSHKKIAGRFVLLSVFIYIITALLFYFYFFPESLYERIIYVFPLIAAPFVIICVKRLLTWWFNRKLKKNYAKLNGLKDKKKEILEKVKETETYKVAKTILDKYAPDEISIMKSPRLSETVTPVISRLPTTPGLRYRGSPMATPVKGNASFLTPQIFPMGRSQSLALMNRSRMFPNTPSTAGLPRLPMKRLVVPQKRTAVDKLVDYFVGDGPNNRYALICRNCSSHNGMALREEFEFISFNCCYCYTFNPARKQRLSVSETHSPLSIKDYSDTNLDTSDAEKYSGESDNEDKIDFKEGSTVTITEIEKKIDSEDTDGGNNYIVTEALDKSSENVESEEVNKTENIEKSED